MDDNTKEKIEAWVDYKSVMEHFSMPKSTLELLVSQGMPHLKIGRARRFKLSLVQKWIEEKYEANTKESN